MIINIIIMIIVIIIIIKTNDTFNTIITLPGWWLLAVELVTGKGSFESCVLPVPS